MLKMKKVIMVVMMVLAIFLFATMNFEVQATGVSDNPIDISDDLDITIDNGENDTANATAANAISANEVAANSQTPQIIQPNTNTSVTTNSNNGNTLPKTGVTEDITVMFFIIVCVVSAIYAYKKIRDYNV